MKIKPVGAAIWKASMLNLTNGEKEKYGLRVELSEHSFTKC